MDDRIETESVQPAPPEDLPRGSSPSGGKGLLVIVGVAALLVGLVLGYLGRGAFSPEARAAKTTATADAVAVQTRTAQNQEIMTVLVQETRHYRGDEGAPVTVIVFSDFQCPFCGRWASEAGRQIETEYVSKGNVRIGYFHYAFLGEESVIAAEASECAADQDKFWEYHDLLFASQNGENQGAFSNENLKGFAKELGLDTQAFDQCLDSGQFKSVIEQQTSFARQLGVQSTPSFLVNGTPLVGAQPFSAFQQIIDQLVQ